MTPEQAAKKIEDAASGLYMLAAPNERPDYAEAVRLVVAATRAFPVMLARLEKAPHADSCHLMNCDGQGCLRGLRTACDCGLDDALRAAREAVEP